MNCQMVFRSSPGRSGLFCSRKQRRWRSQRPRQWVGWLRTLPGASPHRTGRSALETGWVSGMCQLQSCWAVPTGLWAVGCISRTFWNAGSLCSYIQAPQPSRKPRGQRTGSAVTDVARTKGYLGFLCEQMVKASSVSPGSTVGRQHTHVHTHTCTHTHVHTHSDIWRHTQHTYITYIHRHIHVYGHTCIDTERHIHTQTPHRHIHP